MKSDPSNSIIPPLWYNASLDQVAEVVTGKTPPTKRRELYGGSVPFITPADLGDRTLVREGRIHLSEQGISHTRILPKDSVLVCCIGATIGKVGIALSPLATNQQINSLIFNEEIINPKYGFYFCCTLRDRLRELSSSTTIPIINKGRFSKIEIPIAPLPEQEQIANKLDVLLARVEACRERLERVPQILQRFRQSVLNAAFVGELTKNWRDSRASKSQGSPLNDVIDFHSSHYKTLRIHPESISKLPISELPPVPDDWCYLKALYLSYFITKGTTPTKKQLVNCAREIPFIKVYNLTFTGCLDFSIDPTFVSSEIHTVVLARSITYPGDVLMNIVGPPLGKVSLVPDTYPEWNMNQAIVRYRTHPFLLNKFLMYYLLNQQTLNRLTHRSKATAGQFNLTLELCRDLEVPLPSYEEQEKIVSELDRIFSKVNEIEVRVSKAIDTAELLSRSILNSAFSGNLISRTAISEHKNR